MEAHTHLEALHAPIIPILRMALAQMRQGPVSVALDIACGAGHKSDWLAQIVRPGGQLVGIDHDSTALRVAHAARPAAPFAWVAGDALALPCATGCADLAWCSAALGLFRDRRAALREMRRVLRPGGAAVIATGEQLWVRVRRWPADLLQVLAGAYARYLEAGERPVPPADGLDDSWHALLAQAGFRQAAVRAFLLTADLLHPCAAELALADWPALRACIAPMLSAAELQQCDAAAAADPEPEPGPVLLLLHATA